MKKILQKLMQNFNKSKEIREDYLKLKLTKDDKIKLTLIDKYKNL